MAARDRYEISIKCAQCSQEGFVGLSEEDYPFMRNLHRRVEYVKGSFIVTMKNEIQVVAVCKNCDTENLWPER